jgi:hypothetical protein
VAPVVGADRIKGFLVSLRRHPTDLWWGHNSGGAPRSLHDPALSYQVIHGGTHRRAGDAGHVSDRVLTGQVLTCDKSAVDDRSTYRVGDLTVQWCVHLEAVDAPKVVPG